MKRGRKREKKRGRCLIEGRMGLGYVSITIEIVREKGDPTDFFFILPWRWLEEVSFSVFSYCIKQLVYSFLVHYFPQIDSLLCRMHGKFLLHFRLAIGKWKSIRTVRIDSFYFSDSTDPDELGMKTDNELEFNTDRKELVLNFKCEEEYKNVTFLLINKSIVTERIYRVGRMKERGRWLILSIIDLSHHENEWWNCEWME